MCMYVLVNSEIYIYNKGVGHVFFYTVFSILNNIIFVCYLTVACLFFYSIKLFYLYNYFYLMNFNIFFG